MPKHTSQIKSCKLEVSQLLWKILSIFIEISKTIMTNHVLIIIIWNVSFHSQKEDHSGGKDWRYLDLCSTCKWRGVDVTNLIFCFFRFLIILRANIVHHLQNDEQEKIENIYKQIPFIDLENREIPRKKGNTFATYLLPEYKKSAT